MSQATLFADDECVSPAQLTPAEVITYRMIYEAAEAGEPCPENLDLEDAMGFNSTSMGSTIVARLEAKGLIRVDRSHRARIVEIIATGRKTMCPPDQRMDLPRRNRGTHSDGPLLTACAALGMSEEMTKSMIGAGLPGLSRLEKLLDRAHECLVKRRNGYLVGER